MTKILLVEDNEINQDMLSRRLKRKGYEITLAVDETSCKSFSWYNKRLFIFCIATIGKAIALS